MKHYIDMIQLFGAPNGLCSSITELKHIKAVKEPYRHSNRNQPLGQMLLTNQRLDKLAAVRSNFTVWGMLDSPILADDPPSTQGPSSAGKCTENQLCSHVNDKQSKLMVTWPPASSPRRTEWILWRRHQGSWAHWYGPHCHWGPCPSYANHS